jgi:hypothetical protein
MFHDYQEQALSRDMFRRSPLKLNQGELTLLSCVDLNNLSSHGNAHQALSAQVSPISTAAPNAHYRVVQEYPIMSVIPKEPQNLPKLKLRSSVAK